MPPIRNLFLTSQVLLGQAEQGSCYARILLYQFVFYTSFLLLLLLLILFYFFEREKESSCEGRGGTEGEGESLAGSTPCAEPNLALSLTTWRSDLS